MHQNIRYLSNKVLELEILLDEEKPDILILTEHGLKEAEIIAFNLQGYKLTSNFCRQEFKGGGVAIFALEEADIAQINVDQCIEKDIELAAGLWRIRGSKILIIGTYRSPSGNLESYFERLDSTIEKLSLKGNYIVMCGDLNIDLEKPDTKSNNKLAELLLTHNLKSTICIPTRVTATTHSIIDHISTNVNVSDYTATVVNTAISDHHAQCLDISIEHTQLKQKPKTTNTYTERRTLHTSNIDLLKFLLSRECWTDIYQANNINEKYNNFIATITHCLNIAAPKSKTVNRTKTQENCRSNWITQEILEARTVLKRYTQQYKGTEKLKKYRSKYKLMIKEAKANHINKTIEKAHNKIKTAWELINKENKTRKPKTNKSELKNIVINNISITDKKHIAEAFNEQYINAVDKLTQGRTNSNPSLLKSNLAVMNTMYLCPTTEKEIYQIVRNMKNKKSHGDDEISNYLLKNVIHEIMIPLLDVINCSFKEGVFPDKLKIAKIIPILKKGDVKDPTNYRPVSLISSFSKLIETLVLKRVVTFLDKNNILIKEQHGFRKNKSTETAIEDLIDSITQKLDHKMATTAIFMDMTKAFDTIQFQALIYKLEHYGIRGHSATWFTSYLTGRQQYVEIENVFKSQTRTIKHGVPQGSVLGPVLFNIFINDIKTSTNNESEIVLYADDTTVILGEKDAMVLEMKAYVTANMMFQWLDSNNLFLNIIKTEFINFSNRRVGEELNVLINEIAIGEVDTFKFLGITLDNQLNWDEHINIVSKKLSSIIFIMKQLEKFGNTQLLITTYHGLFESYLRYGVTVWGNSSTNNMNKLLKLQKKAIRIIANIKSPESCRKYFKALDILTFPSIYIYKTIMALIKKKDKILTNEHVHYHNTRQKSEFRVTTHNCAGFEKGPTYAGIKLFNNLPTKIKTLKDDKKFHISLKKYLIDKTFYSLSEYNQYSTVH